jgi:hypothetical protein
MAKNNTSTDNNTASNKPQPLNVYVVDESRENRSYWTKVGAAFPHDDGKGFNLVITPGISVSGRLVIREKKPHDAAGED